jgi:hypothetical protein
MKVIFLDIDGVLNNEIFPNAFWAICKQVDLKREQAKSLHKVVMRDEYGNLFCPTAVKQLRWIVACTGAKIVISSTWRSAGLNEMQTMWQMRDLPGEVIGVTPFLNTPRGEEIAEWLRENDVDSYVIIDDDYDMLPEQVDSFIKTNPTYGITFKDAERAVQILGI